MKRIKSKFDMVDHLTLYLPTRQLADAISQMYHLFNRFLSKVVKFYMQSRISE